MVFNTDCDVNFFIVETATHTLSFEKWNGNLYKRVWSKLLQQQIGSVELLGNVKEMLNIKDNLNNDYLPRFEV